MTFCHTELVQTDGREPGKWSLSCTNINAMVASLLPINETMTMSPLWHGQGNIHGFFRNGKSHQPGWATARKQSEFIVSVVNLKTALTSSACNVNAVAGEGGDVLSIILVKHPTGRGVSTKTIMLTKVDFQTVQNYSCIGETVFGKNGQCFYCWFDIGIHGRNFWQDRQI